MPRTQRAYRLIAPALILCIGLIVGSFGQTLDDYPEVRTIGIVLSAIGLIGLLIGKLTNYSARHSHDHH